MASVAILPTEEQQQQQQLDHFVELSDSSGDEARSPSPSPSSDSSLDSSEASSGRTSRSGGAYSSDEDNNKALATLAVPAPPTGADAERVFFFDPSEHFRPEPLHQLETYGKKLDEFRVYTENEDDPIQRRVKRTYYTMHKHQTVDFVRGRVAKWSKFNHAQMTIMEALEKLNSILDESDPDNDLPNIVHAFQTAERIRAVYPDLDWFHLTGLIHDLGKVLLLWGEEQWAVVGDTFIVGCEWGPSVVYRERSFNENPDTYDPRYNSKYGIYEPNCGLDNVLFSWGHDEYMACVLKNHPNCTLPDEGIQMIRLHSFYPWHSGGDYMHLCTPKDIKNMELIREFNKFDLYTKSTVVPDIKALMPYYQGLIDKYIPGKVKW